MIWGLHSASSSTIRALIAARRDGRAKYLLGFNEPDNRGQAAMMPAQAAALWPKLEQTGLELGSPAPSKPDDGWLGQFMAIAAQRHRRVNFIALHLYADFTRCKTSSLFNGKGGLTAIGRAFENTS